MKLLEHYSLKSLVTMKAGGTARWFREVVTKDELHEAVAFARENNLHIKALGAGSNSVFSDDEFDGLVVRIALKGIRIDGLQVIAAAGESWDELVEKTIEAGLSGLENLSLIPGAVGAAPVQNIGAYGVEVASCIESVEVFDTTTLSYRNLTRGECQFGYRDSIFKHTEGSHFIVTAVTFVLQKSFIKNTSYPDLIRWEEKHGVLGNAQAVREAVVAIRRAKLPDPAQVATAGSFWKNPTLCTPHAEALKKSYPELPVFPAGEGLTKISLGWLLDHVLRKKGVREGKVGLYEKQALALVSYGASATEIDMFAKKIEQEVKEKFSIELEREVEFIS